MAVLSLPQYITIDTSCIKYVHPWTDSCRDATLGLLFHAFPHSFKTYLTVYLFTMIMRRKKPTKKLIKKVIMEILQSTIFLTTHAYGFSTMVCALRHITGRFDKYSVSFTPAFLSSLIAIQLERSSRRPILCLYVTNVATETLFRMARWRGWVNSVKHGEIIIFTLSSASILYMFRSDPSAKDSMFSIVRYVIGPYEQAKDPGHVFQDNPPSAKPLTWNINLDAINNNYSIYVITANMCRVYRKIVNFIKEQKRSDYCPHPYSCFNYALQGLGKMLAVGYGVQVALRLVFSAKKILKKPSIIPSLLVSNKVLNLGAFLGLFSGIFRGASCALRWIRKCDSEYHALPAGLLAGTSFWFYPDNTAALYVMWKALQIFYCKLIDAGYISEVPFGTILLYSFSTAVLFHAALLEPQNLRSSYYRFLYGLSGGRIAAMDRLPLDDFLLETSKHHSRVVHSLRLNPNPVYYFEFFGNSYPNV